MPDQDISAQQPFKRLLFLNVDKYQQQVLLPAVIVCLLACVGVFYTLYYIHYVNENIAVLCRIDVMKMDQDIPWFLKFYSFNKVMPWILFATMTTLLGILCWMFYISNRILGPSSRVLKELDEILSGQRKDPIGSRQGDHLYKELLKRINTLIQKAK